MTGIESARIERLVEDYPHLEEKAIVDFINGFSVMSDHLNEKRKVVKKGRSARFLDGLTGQSSLRQELIDTSMEASLGFIKDYVVANEKRLAKNEHFLHQVMSGVSLLSVKLQEVAGDTIDLRQNLTELAEKVDRMEQSLSHRMDYCELQNRAMVERQLALSIFAMKEALFSPEQSLWMLLTRLKYGEFGRWIQAGEGNRQHEKDVQAAMQALKNDCMRILCELTRRSLNQLVDRKTLFAQLSAEDEMLKDALCLVSEHGASVLEPVLLAVNSGEEPATDGELPYVFSNASIYDEMSQLLKPGERHAAIH
ncbi:TPA: hypothetical protein L4U27_003758 [Pseudomonas aeruginosa]|uniref:diguanylate cyclase regulator RdcB family protein n=1 Tax=Pseudomonas aeruginosa TaxID=287 RepID=UPI0039BE5D08|nr:hypothetical protein [Pseudomonas aeruginosa]HBO4535632.1 hypothetical protein [Pseudomonas aeruginosa]